MILKAEERWKWIYIHSDRTHKAETHQRRKSDHLEFEPLGGAVDIKQELGEDQQRKNEEQ